MKAPIRVLAAIFMALMLTACAQTTVVLEKGDNGPKASATTKGSVVLYSGVTPVSWTHLGFRHQS